MASWFMRLAQNLNIDQVIQQVLQNKLGIEEGGPAWMAVQRMGPAACDAINNAGGRLGLSGIDPSAYAKMQVLAKAAGCDWHPQPPKDPNPNTGVEGPVQEMAMPMLGEQEKPASMPSAEVA